MTVAADRPGSRAPPRVTRLQRVRRTAMLATQVRGQASFAFKASHEVERAQRRRLAGMLVHAYETVPYYRETMRRLGMTPGEFRTAKDLARLPIVEREDLQRNPEYFVSTAEPLDSYLLVHSGGSGGEPRKVFHDAASVVHSGAYAERQRAIVRRLAGRRFRYREAIIESPFGTTRTVHEFLARHLLISSSLAIERLYLSLLDPLAHNIQQLEAFRPDVVEGYGSYLEVLFPHLHTAGGLDWPLVVVYGSDAMSASARRLLTEDMELPVSSGYGAVEALHIGFECERGLGYHLNVDLVPLRVVAPSGEDCLPGESGDVIISNLVNRATVLLNYRLGDIAALRTFCCPCGRSLPLLSFIEGRTDDWIESLAGEVLHPQAVRSLFSDEEDIYQYQITQIGSGRFDVAVVARGGVDQAQMRARLEQKFKRRLGAGTQTCISFVDAVPRTASGKVRVVARARDVDSTSR